MADALPLPDLFSAANLIALIGWVALALLPFWRGSQMVAAVIIPLLLCAAYAALIISNLGGSPEGASFSTLEGVKTLFTLDVMVLVGWLHFLAFDLFIGAWEARAAKRQGIPHLLLLPCLFFTFMFGPAGLLLYFIIRTVKARGIPALD